MQREVTKAAALIEWGVAASTQRGESECGDAWIVALFPEGALVGVVDGLGHGPEAAVAAHTAVAILKQHAHEPVTSLIERSHEACRPTRGVVLGVASFSTWGSVMTWGGVGNVEGVLFRSGSAGTPTHQWMTHPAGVVGYKLPRLRPFRVSISRGDTLVLATDGVFPRFADQGIGLDVPPQRVADQILRQFSKDADDALVLVVRYAGVEA